MSRAGSYNLILSISNFKVCWGHGEGLGDLRRNISLSCPPRSLHDMEKHSSKLNRAEAEAAEYPTAEAASSGRLRLEEVVAAVGSAPEVQDSGSCEVNWAPSFPGGPGWGQGGCSGRQSAFPPPPPGIRGLLFLLSCCGWRWAQLIGGIPQRDGQESELTSLSIQEKEDP